MDSANPYEPPSTEIAVQEEHTEELPLASRGERLGAAILDGIIQGLMMFAIDRFSDIGAIGVRIGAALGALPFSFYVALLLQSLLSFVVFVAIQGYFLAETGQTLGKKLLGIKMVTLKGSKPGMNVLLLRRTLIPLLISAIPYAGPYLYLLNICFIFTRQKRCLHDYLAGTKVVQAKALPKGITKPKGEAERISLRFPELILASIIRRHVRAEPHTLSGSTSWAGDLGMTEDEIRAFRREIDHLLPSVTMQGEHPSATYGELLSVLGIPPEKMARVPKTVPHHRPPAPKGPPP